MARFIILALLISLPGAGIAQNTAVPRDGRQSHQPEVILRTGDAVALCLRSDKHWIDFCNGLVQGYADHAILKGLVCIPFGTTRRDLVDIFTGPDVVMTTGYIDNLPAIETSLEMFIRHFPCD